MNLRHRDPWPHVQHHYFQIVDPAWKHVLVRTCGYPPFGAQVVLNGHEWVQRQGRRRRYRFCQEGNCFMVDRTRAPLDPEALKTILGVRHRQPKRKQRPGCSEPELSKEVQRGGPCDVTVFKVRWGTLDQPPKQTAPLDRQYILLQQQMNQTFQLLGLAA